MLAMVGFLYVPKALAADSPVPSDAGQNNLPLLSGHITDADYVLGPGDVITLSDAVMGEQGGARVLEDGSVYLNLVGKVYVGGLTLEQAKEVVNQAYSEYFVHPAITVGISFTHPIRFYVEGAVTRPGVYESGKGLSPELPSGGEPGVAVGTYLYYEVRLTDALLQAGGLQYNADISDITVKRSFPKKEEMHINLWDMLKGDVSQDFTLRDGDVVDVQEISREKLVMDANWQALQSINISAATYRVTVTGSVGKPGTYDIKHNDNVLSVIAQAGGFTQMANKNRVYILRQNSQGQVFGQTVDLSNKTVLRKKPLDEVSQMLPGDIVVVEDSTAKIVAHGVGDFSKYLGTAAAYAVINQVIDRQFNKN